MPTLLTLAFKLVADTAEYSSDLNSAKSKAQEMGSSLTSTGAKLTAGLTLPLLAAGGVAMNAASDLNESMSKVGVVFDGSADKVIKFSENADTALGMSQQAALEAAGTYGNLFTAMGIGEEKSANMSTSLIQLAGDLASFNNLDPTEVLEKLRSGLTGETEPLKSLGVNINEATLQAKGLELGLISGNEKLDAAGKAQAAYALIMQQTTKAQGDFARTQDGVANQTRIAKAQFTDIAATLGTQLLPIGIKILGFVNDLLESFKNLSPEQQKTIVLIGGLVAAIGPALSIIGTLISVVGAASGAISAIAAVISFPLIVIIGALVLAVAGLALAWKNDWGGIQEKTQAVIDWMKPFIQGALDGLKQIFSLFSLAFSGDWEGFGRKLREIWDTAWTNLKGAFTSAWDSLKNIDWGEIGRNIVRGIANGITSAVDWVVKAVQGMGGAAVAAIKGFLGIGSPSKVFEDQGEQIPAGTARGIYKGSQAYMIPTMSAVTSVRPVQVQFSYQPVMSLADQYEAESILKPFIQQGVREALSV